MHHFDYRDGQLYCEGISLVDLANEVGTPTYVYSDATITRHFRVFSEALPVDQHLVCYSVKANSSAAVLATLAQAGAGADIVSGGELFRALRAGIAANKIVFSGVGKTAPEIAEAIDAGILMFNVESEPELELIASIAADKGTRAPIALRVNPDVDPGTHPYIATGLRKSKFGIPLKRAWQVYEKALSLSSIEVRGIDCHIGSQLTSVDPVVDSLKTLVDMVHKLKDRGVRLDYLDIGGGLGIRYSTETPPSPAEYGQAVNQMMSQFSGMDLTLICEPGRVIMGNAGILLSKVIYRKKAEQKDFVILDAAMNDLLRPSLYGAFHGIQPVTQRSASDELITVDVVGPICESGDFIAQDRPMVDVQPGELVAVMSAGAYGFSMASNYNSRRRAPEVLVKGDRYHVARARESYDDLVRHESLPEWLEPRS